MILLYANVVGLLKVIKIEFTTESHSISLLLPNKPTPLAYSRMIAKPQSSDRKVQKMLKTSKNGILFSI